MAEIDAIMTELTESGELVGGEALADPSNTQDRPRRDGVPAVTDGPYAEAKEHLGGYLIVDCESLERAAEIALRVAERALHADRGAAADGRRPAPRCERATPTSRTCCAQLAPQVLGVARPPLRAASTRARTPCRRRCSPPRSSGRAEGVPDNPRAWLITVASRRLTDQLRSEQARRRARGRRRRAGARRRGFAPAPGDEQPPEHDDTLTLLFLCCHPALSPASQIALTLRAVGGLTTAEIARAFLVPEATMAQRISRAKQSIKAAGSRVRDAARARARRAAARRAARALPDLQRGLHRDLGPRPAARAS